MTREGTLLTIDGRPALRFERRYRHPIERVWRAISDADEMSRWFPSNVIGARSVGAELTFEDQSQREAAQEAGEPTRADGPMFRGVVIAHDPPNVFSFSWEGEVLRFELTSDGDGTKLVFTQLLSHQSVAARNGAGWHQCIGALDTLLGVEAEEDVDWMAVYNDYLRRIGPEPGSRSADGTVTWERSSHVDPARVRDATSKDDEIAAWGGAERAGDEIHWDIEAVEHGTSFRLTHQGIGDDAELAARWHALLIQLDMYMASGQLIPVDHKGWIADYERIL